MSSSSTSSTVGLDRGTRVEDEPDAAISTGVRDGGAAVASLLYSDSDNFGRSRLSISNGDSFRCKYSTYK
jgi:hypothetical protein